MSPRLATFLIFVVNGVIIGTWVALIPTIKDVLGASAIELGLVILALNSGALIGQQVTGQLLMRVSSERLLVPIVMIYPWLLILPVIAPSALLLAFAMMLFGFFNTTMDVAMNAHGVALEDKGGRSIMSGLHAGWSLGGVIGAIGVALALALESEPMVEVLLAAAASWVLGLATLRRLGQGSVRAEAPGGLHLPTRAILPLAVLIVLIAFVEGGLADWGGVYLREGVGAETGEAALAFAALSAGLLVARVGGDWAKDRIGSVRLIQLGMLLTAVAIAVALLVGETMVVLAGLVVAGVGLANTVPQIFGAAARVPPGGPSLSAVFTALTLTFMVGPAIIGVVSDTTAVGTAMWLFVAASLVVAMIVPRFPSAETNPRLRSGRGA